MNRFRTKKRAKEEAAAAAAAAPPRPSNDSDSSLPFRPFRKGKKQPEVEKVEVDITNALPSNDDFRTSLLMSGLSARFSMLREQDDPSTKIGKASDDSVLFPKRQSRLDYAALRGLGDIAEVESIKAGSPFARDGSFNSDADSMTGGSIMTRSKPIEGNNLFGGRQKIYKIPVNSSKTSGGMGGRALYEDDVSMSAFQKWRQAEKERESSDDDQDDARAEAARADAANRLSGNTEADSQRPDSDFLGGWDRKRETSSTTSSVPSQARNSTAATSVTSTQPPAPASSAGPASANSTLQERKKRLYETGLNHDLQEQQSSALSRFETLAQRTFSRAPDSPGLSLNSPTIAAFKERFSGDRKVLAKASAPNLRSTSPTTTISSAGTPDPGLRAPSRTDGRPPFIGIPPVSPPVSESEESPMLPIQPNDMGKATALGVFQKPSLPYDESRYAERQRQLQQGRETPTQKQRPDSRESRTGNGSRSSSRLGQTSEPKRDSPAVKNSAPLKEDIVSSTFLLGDDSESSPAVSPRPLVSPQLVVERPPDNEHPAYRESDTSMLLPFAISASSIDLPSTLGESSPPRAPPAPKTVSPVDSPTLGPTSGLSGMVRQHLRAGSNASSIYNAIPPPVDLDARFPLDPDDTNSLRRLTMKSNPWDVQGQDWDAGLETSEPMVEDNQSAIVPAENQDGDEFSSQLADGARRVRERLTSYAETDSRSSSPNRDSEFRESTASQRTPSGSISTIRTKESRGSLASRGRDDPQSKAMKMLGLDDRSYSPVGRKGSVDRASEKSESENPANDGGESHPGLKAFRQARRDLQRLREQETQARHQPPPEEPQAPAPPVPAPRLAPEGPSEKPRAASRERKAAPGILQQRMLFENATQNAQNSLRPGPRVPSRGEDRDRSGSESSNGGFNGGPGGAPRFRDFSAVRDERQQLTPSNGAPRPKLRSPGLPGTDIKNSPIMPPQARGQPPAKLRTNLASSDNLHARYPHGQPSPISPIPSPLSTSGRSTPIRRPSVPHISGHDGHGEGMRRKLSTKDISEPTLVASSHVPTITLPGSRSGSSGNSPPHSAPPLPPINPRRRHENQTSSPIRSRSQGNESAMDSLPGGMI